MQIFKFYLKKNRRASKQAHARAQRLVCVYILIFKFPSQNNNNNKINFSNLK